MAARAAVLAIVTPPNSYNNANQNPLVLGLSSPCTTTATIKTRLTSSISLRRGGFSVLACLPPPSSSSSDSGSQPKTRLFVSGLSFRSTEEGLQNAFQGFGQLVEGLAFLDYATEEESQKAIEGMHGKFLDGRVIFVEIAKPRSELRQAYKQNQRQN